MTFFLSLFGQATVDLLPPPRTFADVASRLSDDSDTDYPIFRAMTIASFVLDGSTGELSVWCCGAAPASGAAPIYRWNLHSFFDW